MTAWASATLVETAAAIASGAVRAREVAEACLDREARFGATLGAFVEVDAAVLRAAAEAADVAVTAGAPLGPLHGVPLAHKDMYYRAGRVSACGSRLREGFRPAVTATVLERLDAAGALEMGRLAMVEFAMGPHGFNPNYPQVRNPWNTAHIPCGSSSGSGVAVAARLVHGSLGSDTGGSVRCPAAVNGVVGLLPTHGRVSRHGMMPMSFSLDSCGPLARTAQDVARLFDVIAGPDPRDATTLPAAPGGCEAALLDAAAPLPRLGLARGYFDTALHGEVAAVLAAAVATFERAGMPVPETPVDAALLREAAELHPLVMKAEGAANHMAMLRAAPEDYSFEVGQRLQAGFFIPAADYIQALKLRGQHLRRFAEQAFATVDVLVTPLIGIPVPTIAETSGHRGKAYLDMVVALTGNTKVVNWLGLPAVSVPCGFTASGLPVAMQLVGRPLAEAALLRVAHRFQQLTDWHKPAPALG